MSIDRKDYWNDDYFKYWKARVDEANEQKVKSSHLISGDALTTDDKVYFNSIELLQLNQNDKILELGCGFGRSVPFIAPQVKEVAAVDISESMIREAREQNKEFKNVSFYVSEAESLAFPSEGFSKVICFAVFDALDQATALKEINRVLSNGGRALITGKSDSYFEDDKHAIVAEQNARAKGHPNFFTDVSFLKSNIEKFGFIIKKERFFEYRGDTSLQKYTENMPTKFYEYTLIIEKKGSPAIDCPNSISSMFSKTFKFLNGGAVEE